jgi:hypothetical protein
MFRFANGVHDLCTPDRSLERFIGSVEYRFNSKRLRILNQNFVVAFIDTHGEPDTLDVFVG